MRKLATLFILFSMLFDLAAAQIVMKRIGINFPTPVGIEYHQASNSILISTNYPTGNPKNFARLEFDGSEVAFSSIRDLTEEVKIACVRRTDPPNEQFQEGECFTGNGNSGGVTRISPNGLNVQTQWVLLPSNPGLLRGSLYVDNWHLYNGRLAIVTTSGYCFLVDNNKNVVQVGKTPSETHLEGMIIVPDNVGYGTVIPRKIIAGDENARRIWVFHPDNPGQAPNAYSINVAIEDIDFIFPGENFFGVNYAENRLIGAPASEWSRANLVNKILLTQESAALFTLDWTGANPVGTLVPINQAALANVGGAISQWEHVTFAKAGILEIPPADPICYLWRDRSRQFNFGPIHISGRVFDFYNYRTSGVRPFTYNFFTTITSIPSLTGTTFANRVTIFPVIDFQNIISIIVAVDDVDGSEGELELEIKAVGASTVGNPIRDDNVASPTGDYADTYSWQNGQGYFKLKWGANTADGFVLSPLLVAGLNQGMCFNIKVVRSVGIDQLQVISNSSTSGNRESHLVNLPTDQVFTMCVYDCNRLCFLFDECTGCAASNCTWCETTGKCLQPTAPELATCGTQYSPNTGYCPCNMYQSSCGKCSENPNCGWCCQNGGTDGACLTGSVSDGTACSAGVWRYHNCTANCATPCARGACVCGECQCPDLWTGPTCDIKIGCDGIPGSGKETDVCGICGGDGTSCLGCDGIAGSGKVNDSCGECGGTGHCFSLCPFDNCNACARAAEFCYWCYDAASGFPGKCLVKNVQNCTSGVTEIDPNTDRCQQHTPVPTAVLAGAISGAVIGIIIAVIAVALILAAIGGTKAYQYYMKNKRTMGSISNNPMYVDDKKGGVNPFHEDK